jgi:hypothetical protein
VIADAEDGVHAVDAVERGQEPTFASSSEGTENSRLNQADGMRTWVFLEGDFGGGCQERPPGAAHLEDWVAAKVVSAA